MNKKDVPSLILFVCAGNICRSPAAEGVMQDLVNSAGHAGLVGIDSAGTHGYHTGELADPRMREAAGRRGLNLTSRARQVRRADLDEFSFVIAMDNENLAYLNEIHEQPKAAIHLLSDFLDKNSWPADVPDPYYGGPAGFEKVLDMLQAAAPQLLEHVLESRKSQSLS